MSNDWTIRVEGLSKKFGLSLQRSMVYGVKDVASRLLGRSVRTDQIRPGEFWAIKDLSFDVKRGESLGIMGPNGAGKTTLLRILSGVFPPDAGQVAIRGRVGTLLAAGAGFAPMLSGRENVYVNGALLGLSKVDIDRRFDEIVEFADVGPFIEAPVKHYSSGMFVRLGFAIAALCEPDVLLVDEVLAVGDLNFQKKCYDYLHRLKAKGTTIILVSHSVGAVWAVCERGLFMSGGTIAVDGPVEEAIRAYHEASGRDAQPEGSERLRRDHSGNRGGTGDVTVETVTLRSTCDQRTFRVFDLHDPVTLEATVQIHARIAEPLFRFTIDAAHYKFIACLDSYEQCLALSMIEPGTYTLRVELPWQNLMPGSYTVGVAVCRRGFGGHLFFWNGAAAFQIAQPRSQFFYAEDKAVLYLTGRWTMSDAQGRSIASTQPTWSEARAS
jgi:lipopolysaccharide transport system ATP-binding protein